MKFMPNTASRGTVKRADLPLAGKTVVLTRPGSQSRDVKRRLRKLGARTVDFPVIRIAPPQSWAPLDRALKHLASFDWLVFTSVNGVSFFMKRLKRLRASSSVWRGRKIAAIGEATAAQLRLHGCRVYLKPADFTSDALFREFKRRGEIRGRSLLLVRSDIAPDRLRSRLERAGAQVTEVKAYRTLAVNSARRSARLLKRLLNGGIDFIFFASESAVRNFFDCFPRSAAGQFKTRWIAIGHVTAKAIRRAGYRPYREAGVCTMNGMVDALLSGR